MPALRTSFPLLNLRPAARSHAQSSKSSRAAKQQKNPSLGRKPQGGGGLFLSSREAAAQLSRWFLAPAICIAAASPAWCAPPKSIHVFVALCDNKTQGIQPVPAELGDGAAPRWNLYWGALYGVKTYFKKSSEWELIQSIQDPSEDVLERIVFHHRASGAVMVADAYRGSRIKRAIEDFLSACRASWEANLEFEHAGQKRIAGLGANADLVAYIGHNGLMEFQVEPPAAKSSAHPRDAIVLACASRDYFARYLKDSGTTPLLLTTGLMAPEAYTLKSALDGWLASESHDSIRRRAAQAYADNQDCGLRAALNLFTTE